MSSTTNQSLQKGPGYHGGYSKKKFGGATDLNQIATPSRPKVKQSRRRGHHAEWKQQPQPSKDVVEDQNVDFMQGEKVNKGQLLSDSKEFVCKICCEHVVGSAPVLTRCSHLFCGDCFARWAEVCPVQQSWAQKARKANSGERSVPCPACEEMLDVPRDLDEVCKDTSKSTNLVLWRMLYSVKVCCKNNPQYAGTCGSCDWVGDYGEYEKHVGICRNTPITTNEEAQKVDSAKTTRSGSPASRDPGSSSADSPQWSPDVSEYFRAARGDLVSEESMIADTEQSMDCSGHCTQLLQTPPGLQEQESMPEWPDAEYSGPPGLTPDFGEAGKEDEEEDEIPEWAEEGIECAPEWAIEPNQVSAPPPQIPELPLPASDVALQTKSVPPQWSPRVNHPVANVTSSHGLANGSSIEERSVEESELPSNSLAHLMSLLSEIDEDGGDRSEENETHEAEENKCSTNLPPPDAAIPPMEKAAKPPPPPTAAAPTVEHIRASVQLDQLVPASPQPAPHATPAHTPQVIPARLVSATTRPPTHASQMPPPPAGLPGPQMPLPPVSGFLPPPKVGLLPGPKPPVRGLALFSFHPTEVGHIGVQVGEPIEIFEYHPSGWCHCRSLARPAQRSGWAPNWVLPPPKVDAPPPAPMPGMPPMPMPLHAPPSTMAPQLPNVPAQAAHAPPSEAFPAAPGLPVPAPGSSEAMANKLPPPPPGICSPPSEPPSTKMPCAPAPTQPVVEVRHEYKSTGPSFLSLAPRDLVEIFRRDASGWAYGRKVGCTGKPEGWFPAWVCAH